MIVWLASYPKSGNTLLRSILGTYFFSEDGNFKFEHTYKIGQFPNYTHFHKVGIDINNDKEIFKNYVKAQELLNQENKKVKFLKTHSAFFDPKEDGSSFSNAKNTLGALYIVRDPRNVATSYAYHYQLSINEAVDQICNKNLFNIKNQIIPETYISSWKWNLLSWKRPDIKVLFIKYEELVNNKKKTLINVFKFFETLGMNKSSFNIKKLNMVIKSTEFSKMKELEKKTEFHESIIDEKTGKKKPFFNLGPQNSWKENLDSKNREKIEKIFKKEMIELGYL